MPTTAFVSQVTLIPVAWLNEVDAEVFGSQSAQYTSLQAFLTANAGKCCRVRGTHSLSANVVVPAGTWVDARGSALTWSEHCTGLTFADGGGWLGGSLTGAGNASYNANGIAISCIGTDNTPLAPTYVTAPVLQDITITEWGAYGVFAKYTNHLKVRGCRITEIGYAAVGGGSCSYADVSGNYFGQITPGTAGNAYGCFIDRSEGTLTADPLSKFCKINYNVVEDIPLWEGLDTHGGQDFEFIGNIIRNCKTGIAVTDSDVSNDPTYGPKRVVVMGNHIYLNGNGSGIIVTGAFNVTHVDYAEDIVVKGNTIYRGGVEGDTLEGGIRMRGTKRCVVADNILNEPVVVGINLYFDNYDALVQGNIITDVWDDAVTAPAGVRVGSNNNTGLIQGNIFSYTAPAAAPGTYVAVYSIYISSALTGLDLDVKANTFHGLDSTHLTYTEGTSTGVNSSDLARERGTATVALVSGQPSNVVLVTFGKNFPSLPKITGLVITAGRTNGGKAPILDASSIAVGSFTLTASPSDFGNWSASGNLTVSWEAST